MGAARRPRAIVRQQQLCSHVEEPSTARNVVACRETPSESNCRVAISEDSEEELIEVAVQHAVTVHGHKDKPEFRKMLKQAIKEGSPRP